MRILCTVVFVCMVATMASLTCASDLNFGSYARSAAMGGAGLALTDDPSTSSVVNPAAGAATGARFQFVFPSLDFHTRGASFSDLRSRTSEVSGATDSDALSLIETFGKAPTTLAVGAVGGFAGPIGVTAEGEAQGIITPGPAFSNWATAGLPKTAADLSTAVGSGAISNAALVAAINSAISGGTISNMALLSSVLTAGTNVQAKLIYAIPAVSWSTGLKAHNGGKLWVGARMRWLQSETHTWNIQQNAGTPGQIDLQASEDLTQKAEDSGFGADLGLIYQPKNSVAQWGMVVNNFYDAGLAGIETPRMLSIGMASQPRAKLRYAVDLVNINGAYDENMKLRMGAEWIITNSLVLRAGNSGDSWTYGVGILGLNFAFSDNAPNMISRVLRF